MKKTALFLVILFLSKICFSQNIKEHDSIVHQKMDSLLVNVLKLSHIDIDSAKALANYGLNYSKKNNNLRGIAQSYSAIANVYSIQGDDGKALVYDIKSADIFKSIGEEILFSKISFNIGVSLMDQNEYEEAKHYVQTAHDYYLKVNSEENLPLSYLGVGIVDTWTNKSIDKVMESLDKGEALALKNGDTLLLSNILNSKAVAFLKNKVNYPTAISGLKKAIKLVKIKQPDNHFNLGYSYVFLSKAYWKTKAYEKALSYNDSSLMHYKAYNYPKGLKLVYENRKDILESLGKYKESVEAHNLFNYYSDSIFKKERVNQIVRLKTKYETDQIITQKETAEAKLELTETISQQNKNYFIGALIISFLILMTSIFYYKRLKDKKKAELVTIELKETQKRLAIEKQYRDSELKALKAQMNPHFIFNALNSIQDYIVLNQKNLASDYLGKFADLIRNYLHFSDTGFISIPDEVHNLNLYLELEKLRFEDVLEYTFNVDFNANSDAINIPTMLIQPYVENALKHGLLHKKNNRKLNVSISKLSDKTIECIIEDNGIGREKSKEINQKREAQHKSFALNATTERLDLLNYGRDKKIGVNFIDLKENEKATGTKVILTIPILKN